MRLKSAILFFSVLVSLLACGQPNNAVLKAKTLLEKGNSVTSILTNPQFDSVRPETSFRELIKQYADQKPVIFVTNNEAGEKIKVKGKLTKNGEPLSNVLIYVYQTDNRGWYGSDRVHFQMNEGDRRHARLFAYVKTNAKGEFEFHTIQPHGYPQSDLPAHIHFEVFENEKTLLISELLFDDDERLQGEIRARSQREGFYISQPVVQNNLKTYNYTINTK